MCIVGEPTAMKVVIAHKGKRSFYVDVRGREAHSSLAPRAVNAVEYAAELVAFIRRIARRLETEGPFDAGFDVPHGTVLTGVIAGGTTLNIVPRDCRFEFELRHLPQDDPERVLAEVRAHAQDELVPRMHAVAPEAGITFRERSTFPGLDTRADEEVVLLAKELSGHADHGKVAFGTEAGLFQAKAGIPTVVCGPADIEQAHKPDEFVALEQVAACERFMSRLIEHVCRPAP